MFDALLKMLSTLLFLTAAVGAINGFGSFHPSANQFGPYQSGASQYSTGNPTARHKNHCAYVIEKTVSYTIQEEAAPYVKAEYNKCGWRKKCPALMYRMFYKPKYKVAYKTMTELEWRCCPGFTGVGCKIGPAAYGMKAMPPFKGPVPSQMGSMPSNKGPQPSKKGPMPSYKRPVQPFKGPRPSFKGPTPPYKGMVPSRKAPVPLFKGQTFQSNFHGNPWNPPQTPSNMMGGYPVPNVAPAYHETSFDPYPDHQDPESGHPETVPEFHNPLTDDQEPLAGPVPDDHESVTDYQDPLPEQQSLFSQIPKAESVPETPAPSGGSKQNQDTEEEDSVTAERLNRMEEDVQRISLGLETLRGKVTGLEDHLRTSLREDANRMLSALLSAAPAPVPAPSLDSTIGFGNLPGGAPDLEGSDMMMGQLPSLGELAAKITELHSELQTKSTELTELRGTVLEHDGVLQRFNNGAVNLTGSPKPLETLVESKLSEARTAILGGFERRVESSEQQCATRVTEVRLQCKKEMMEGQEHLQHILNGSMVGLRNEFGKFHAQVMNLDSKKGCCLAVSELNERLVLLEEAMNGLNQSQRHLQAELGGHKDHMEGMLEGRLVYVEEKLGMAEKQQEAAGTETPAVFETCLEDRIMALEKRLFAAVEEIGNVTAPALLEGQAVPTLETELESIRKRVEVDVDRIQKQLGSLEVLCTSSCSPQPVLTGHVAPLPTTEEENHHNINEQLISQTERLNQLNATINSLLVEMVERQEEEGLKGEVMLLKVSIHSVNHTLCGLKDSFGKVVKEVGQTNLTWQEREERLAQQVKGVVQLVGRQASMLGAGERRLTRLKGDLQDLRRRLATELQGCQSTALGVQKEVSEVGGRVSRVESQCVGLTRLADDLELIRGELDKHSEGYFSQVNNTLINHSVQLSELREGLKNCTEGSGFTKAPEEHQKIMAITQSWVERHTEAPVYPRGDQFTDPTWARKDQTQAP